MRLIHKLAVTGFSALTLLSAGCDRSDDSDRSDKPFIPLVGDPDHDPVRFNVADEKCQKQTETVPLTQTVLHAWSGETVEAAMTPILNIKTEKSLVSPAVKLTSYGDVYERECDFSKASGSECADENGREKGWHLTDTKGPLRVCNDNHDYGRDTVEGVGLAAMNWVEKAFRRYSDLAPANAQASVKPIYLSVLPDFVDFYDNFEVNGETKRLKIYITHNMAYFPSGPMIAVFPEGQHHVGESAGYFWESAFVLAHEYGHHIDNTRHGKMLSAMGLSWNPAKHGYQDNDVGDLQASGQQLSGSARSQVMGAVGEGFADLLAYYSLEGKSDTLVGLPCFGKNRDISRANFINDDAKVLTEERVDDLVSGTSTPEGTCGNPPDYGDIHNIGAIIAYAVDQTFAAINEQRTDLELGSPADFDERYRMALAWLDAVTVEALAADGSDGLAMIQPIVSGLEKVAQAELVGAGLPLVDDGAQKGKNLVCKTTLQLIPALTKAPFAAADGNCPE